jgi:hypothetical protein
MKRSGANQGQSASELISKRIAGLGDWRGKTLSRMRKLIKEADPDVVEEWKWMGAPVWSHHGNICTGESYKSVVKLTFVKGASLKDPARLFNSSLDGNVRRAIDIHEGEEVEESAFKALVRQAAALNSPGKSKPSKKVEAANPRKAVAKSSARKPTKSSAKQVPAHPAMPKASSTKSKGPAVAAKPTLLAGGNPQIAKADGDAPVQAYIAAMPGWKRDVGRRLDALIVRTVPGVRKAVKWNSPFYGVEGLGWFLSLHCFTKYVKVAFFRGTSLRPVPPGESKHKEVRYLDLHEDDELDEAQLATWIRQAAALPGWVP